MQQKEKIKSWIILFIFTGGFSNFGLSTVISVIVGIIANKIFRLGRKDLDQMGWLGLGVIFILVGLTFIAFSIYIYINGEIITGIIFDILGGFAAYLGYNVVIRTR